MSHGTVQAALAQITLRAYPPAPARVELEYRSAPGRLARAVLSLVIFWGGVPLLIWIPPHYPWVAASLAAGGYLAYRHWTGRYHVCAFAGLCPRCGRPLSMGLDRTIDLPHTLTCFHCHFEPQLEVRFRDRAAPPLPEHHRPECVGLWEPRWLADEPLLVCGRCLAHAPATPEARRAAQEENARAALLERLADEGRMMM